MNKRDLKAVCLEMMATADAVYLSTLEDGGYPRMRALLNLRNRKQFPGHVGLFKEHDEDFLIYLSTNTSSRKHKNIEQNPRIGLYFCHPKKFFGLSLIGDAEIVEDLAVKESIWAPGWERYYPTTGDASDPDYAIVQVLPKSAQGWYRSETFEFAFTP